MPNAEIFSQGDEVITGQTVDTNAAWLSESLFDLGFTITRHTAVGDRLGDMAALLKEIANRADLCICTGGLGPTEDDLTAEAVSNAFDQKLVLDKVAVSQIREFFSRTGRKMPEVNLKQAMLPVRADRVDNLWGTAPAFSLQAGDCWFVFLPGVPYEMRQIFREKIRPQLLQRFTLSAAQLVTLRTVGIGESSIQEKLNTMTLPESVVLGFRTGNHENQIKLLFPSHYNPSDIEFEVARVADRIGRYLFGIDGPIHRDGDIDDVIAKSMDRSAHSLSIIETVSGGRIASRCARRDWFMEGIVAHDLLKLARRFDFDLEVKLTDIDSVSRLTGHLAQSIAGYSQTTLGLAQCWSQNWRAYDDKSAFVECCTGLSTPQGTFYHTAKLSGPAGRKQTVAAMTALDTLRRYLQGYFG